MTQKQMVINYIDDFGSITQLQALADLGIMRLASRISDLKEDGFKIVKTMEKTKNRYGKNVRYARYRKENTNV